jgi:LPXTG-motif cell wall-anchored protein
MNIVASLRRVGFYAGRLRKENITKVLIMSTASLALVLQLVAGIFPVQPNTAMASTANNADNIIYQGVQSTADLLAIYDHGTDAAGHADLQQIYSQFGVTRADLANTTMGSYKTNDFNGQLKTLSRVNWANSGRSAVAITATGTTIYTGPFLNGANGQAFVQPALIGKRASDGQWFAITLNCGNLVYVVPPQPPTPPKPAAACVELGVQQISRTNVTLTAKATTSNGATISGYRYVVTKDSAVVTDTVVATTALDSQLSQTYATPGDYVAVVTAQTSLGDQSSANCAKTFTVTPPPVVPIDVCELATNKIITIDEKNFDSTKYSKNTADCHPPVIIKVCDLTTHTVIPINEKDFDSSKQSKDTANCVVATPPELPHTGAGSAIGSVLGLGSVVASLGYYIASRRSLLSAFLNQ